MHLETIIKKKMKFHFNPTCNLLIPEHDRFCTQFIEGKITRELFLALEVEYMKRKELFTINLN